MLEIIKSFTEWLWGWPLLALVMGGGLIINIRTGFIQLRYFPYIMRQTLERCFLKMQKDLVQFLPSKP